MNFPEGPWFVISLSHLAFSEGLVLLLDSSQLTLSCTARSGGKPGKGRPRAGRREEILINLGAVKCPDGRDRQLSPA
ncbi:hypothetical protein DFH07DRAFT_72632 [Mycena maculata]|uniref:Uncharacterized protein n=1 Tax=Mycena maculata TaxID=230809 RepID=A0AAD7N0C3_9AGAR|nr:hypothetical protein DFH07DRAFT_72632 [Mycena maculata]